jgi:two-component system chemotaxis response regulator CheV
LPQSVPPLLGIADIRKRSVPVLDLGAAIRHPESSLAASNYLVVTEFNRSVQGFLVSAVERIVNIAVENVKPPPDSSGGSYLTAVTRFNDDLIQIIDVEKVLAEVIGGAPVLSEEMRLQAIAGATIRVLIVDDNATNRRILEYQAASWHMDVVANVSSASAALRALERAAQTGTPVDVVLLDYQMPEMNGLELAQTIKGNPLLANTQLVVLTSMCQRLHPDEMRAMGISAWLVRNAVPPGARVAIVQRDGPWAAAMLLGVSHAHAAVPLNPTLSAADYAFAVSMTDPPPTATMPSMPRPVAKVMASWNETSVGSTRTRS